MLSNCSHDSRGEYSGDIAGDQTGGEWAIVDWYKSYGGWDYVLRHPSATVREWIAVLATEAANNDNIGYDQSERMTFWNALKECGYRPKNINYPVEANCSSGVLGICKAVGYLVGDTAMQNISASGYTGTEKGILESAGFYAFNDYNLLSGDSYLCRGDILLNVENHTSICITNGVNSGVSDSSNATTSATNTGSVNLGPINYDGTSKSRGIVVNWSVSKTNPVKNTSTVYYEVVTTGTSDSVYLGGVYVYINGKAICSNLTKANSTLYNLLASGEISIEHDTDGNKSFYISVKAKIGNAAGSSYTAKKQFDLERLIDTGTYKASALSPPSTLTMGESTTLSVKASSSSYGHKLYYTWGNESQKLIVTKKTGSFDYNWIPPISMGNAIPTKNSGVGQFVLKTYKTSECSDSTLIGEQYVNFKCYVPSDAKPDFSNPKQALDNGTNDLLNGVAVSGITKVRLTGKATAKYGATIKKYVVSDNYTKVIKTITVGNSKTASLNYTSNVLTNKSTTQNASVKFTVTVYDSRGNTTKKTLKAITLQPYKAPKITILTADRNTDKTTTATVTVRYYWSTILNNKDEDINQITGWVYTKKAGGSSWSKQKNISKKPTAKTKRHSWKTTFEVDNLDDAFTYIVRCKVKDIVNSVSKNISLPTVEVLLNFREGGKGLGVGKIAEADQLQIALDTVVKSEKYDRYFNLDKDYFHSYAVHVKDGASSGTNVKNYILPGSYFIGTMGVEGLPAGAYATSGYTLGILNVFVAGIIGETSVIIKQTYSRMTDYDEATPGYSREYVRLCYMSSNKEKQHWTDWKQIALASA